MVGIYIYYHSVQGMRTERRQDQVRHSCAARPDQYYSHHIRSRSLDDGLLLVLTGKEVVHGRVTHGAGRNDMR